MDQWNLITMAGGVTFGLTALLVPVSIRAGRAWDVTDRPDRGKLHTRVTPCLGGVAIVLAVLAAAPILPALDREAGLILAGALLIAAVGLVDDIRMLPVAPRLLVEAVAGAMAFAAGARLHLVGDLGDFVLTVALLIVITNSYNLLDNMDGVAGVVAVATAGTLLVGAVMDDQVLVAGIAALVIGACMGFLIYNWAPAKVFMGDAGSLFLGYVLGATALKLHLGTTRSSMVVALLLVLAPALFDTTLVVISRVSGGRPVFSGGTDHTAHRLLRRGLTPHRVAIILGVATVSCGALGVAVGSGALPVAPVFLGAAAVGGGLLIALLREPLGVPVGEVRSVLGG